jgi:2-polyprenyl-6-methoxyphenol hydroxylase-like FAD-dependent oxidoreductase
MADHTLQTDCCVVGGGPAGIMLGFLLAREGVHVTVLEKHGDFFRDFRGDTVHPSTLDVLHELDLLKDFLRQPHQKVESAGGMYGDYPFQAADFRHLPTRCKFAALMPQWDFLNFLSQRARQFPSFDLRLRHDATGVASAGDRITGVVARDRNGDRLRIDARLVVGCDGRHSAVRAAANLELLESGVPIDVLWFRIGRQPDDPEDVLGILNYGKALILINRNNYFQAGMIVRKGSFNEIRQRGLEEFRRSIVQLAPYLSGRVDELKDWEDVKLLTVQLNRLRQWYRPGLLCIGDAAHAMSPAGGVGINLAIQDAVATANILIPHLRNGRVPDSALAAVQERREFPTRVTQAVQKKIHDAFARVFDNPGELHAPAAFKVASNLPGIHRVLGYAIGVGVRPEHVRVPAKPRGLAVALGRAIGIAAGTIVGLAMLRRRRTA